VAYRHRAGDVRRGDLIRSLSMAESRLDLAPYSRIRVVDFAVRVVKAW
jgi:hypothetical protein